ncbi:MAG: transcription elongation factor GreA [Clostridia bacterium]|nr:transcription elongation factor GreA [Clostridia bacterium]
MKKIILTAAALEKVLAERDELIARRKEISEEIKKARGFGDLSENAEYHAAREAQSFNESEIMRLTELLENHELAQDSADKDVVAMNSTVRFLYVDDNEEQTVKIVSKIESDPFEDKLSNESPIGGGLIGKKVDDEFVVETPNGELRLRVLEIL